MRYTPLFLILVTIAIFSLTSCAGLTVRLDENGRIVSEWAVKYPAEP